MKISNALAMTALTILCSGAAATSVAAIKAEIDQRVTATLTEFNALTPANQSLGKKAAGMLVFPKVTKAGVGVAGEFGEGVLQVSGKTVGYYSIGSVARFVAQINANDIPEGRWRGLWTDAIWTAAHTLWGKVCMADRISTGDSCWRLRAAPW